MTSIFETIRGWMVVHLAVAERQTRDIYHFRNEDLSLW